MALLCSLALLVAQSATPTGVADNRSLCQDLAGTNQLRAGLTVERCIAQLAATQQGAKPLDTATPHQEPESRQSEAVRPAGPTSPSIFTPLWLLVAALLAYLWSGFVETVQANVLSASGRVSAFRGKPLRMLLDVVLWPVDGPMEAFRERSRSSPTPAQPPEPDLRDVVFGGLAVSGTWLSSTIWVYGCLVATSIFLDEPWARLSATFVVLVVTFMFGLAHACVALIATKLVTPLITGPLWGLLSAVLPPHSVALKESRVPPKSSTTHQGNIPQEGARKPFSRNANAIERRQWFAYTPPWDKVSASTMDALADKLEPQPEMFEVFVYRSMQAELVHRYAELDSSIRGSLACAVIGGMVCKAGTLFMQVHFQGVEAARAGDRSDALREQVTQAGAMAIDFLEVAIALESNLAPAYLGLALLNGEINEYAKALDYARRGLELVEMISKEDFSSSSVPLLRDGDEDMELLENQLSDVISRLETEASAMRSSPSR